MNVLLFILIIYGIVKLISSASRHTKERKREREIIDIRVEQARRAEEARIMREDFKRQQDAEKARQQRQAAIEKEQERQRKEQERLRKEQERQAKEQKRLAEEQRKQAFAIRDLQYRMKVCEEKHVTVMQKITNLSALLNLAEAEYSEAEQSGNDKKKATALRKIISINEQLASAREKERKIRYDWNTAKQKLSA